MLNLDRCFTLIDIRSFCRKGRGGVPDTGCTDLGNIGEFLFFLQDRRWWEERCCTTHNMNITLKMDNSDVLQCSAARLSSQPFLQTCYYHCLCSNIDKLHRIIHWEKLLYSYTSQLASQPVDCKAVLQKFIVCGKDKGFIKRLYQILFAETDHFSSIVFDMYF